MKSSCLVFFIIFFCRNATGFVADSTKNLNYGVQGHYGFIIPHSASIREVSHTSPVGIELSCNTLHTSLEKYRVFNAYWISGMEARYINFQNRDIVGGVFDVTLFAEPVVSFGRNYLFTIRGGGGISYHSKIYDPVLNSKNMFFSSKLNFPLFIDARFKYRIGEKTFFTTSACYNHISNGGIKQPNKGMNFPTLALGIEYYRNQFPSLNGDFKSDFGFDKPDAYMVVQGLTSVKVLGSVDALGLPEKPAFIYGFHTRFVKPLSFYYALHGGAELIIDGYIKETISRENLGTDYKRLAITAGQDFMLGKMVVTQLLGYYVYSPYKARNAVYQKYELAYKVLDKMMIGVYMKAHLQVAELMGVNVSWKLF